MTSICIKENNKEILNFILKNIIKNQNLNIKYSCNKFKNFNNIIIHNLDSNNDYFYSTISATIAKSIFKFYEPKLIIKIINLDYFYFNSKEKQIIFDEYKIIRKKEKTTIAPKIQNYIKNNKSIIIEGFVNFRLKEYINYLNLIVEKSVNQFVIDKEYINFVNLLKNYVDTKIPNDIELNLVYIHSKGILLDNLGNQIELEKFDSPYLSDISFSTNDYILNTLIGILPRKITIHLISKPDQFTKTIELIFGNKIEYCLNCSLCKTFKIINKK